MSLLFLSSGLFLGWALGANDAANVFGTAVGTRMIRFRTAAMICAVFVILGAVYAGSGTTLTLSTLGSVNAMAGAFTVTLAAGFSVYWMTRLKLPVSTSQAIVGAIIGWNFFSGSLTNFDTLQKIVLSWIFAPVFAAIISASLYLLIKVVLSRIRIHLLRLDMYLRAGLILSGAFGAYSLGANNIANVMGVFVPVAPFSDMNILNLFKISGAEQLFFLGGLAIAIGAYTYSRRVMETVGESIMKLSAQAALVVVLAQALVLFLFSSPVIERWLIEHNLPPLPLVPISSSHAVVGAVFGIGLVKGARGIRYQVLGSIASGWATTPVIAGILSFISLFFLQNVFGLQVSEKVTYRLNEDVRGELHRNGLDTAMLNQIGDEVFINARQFYHVLDRYTEFPDSQKRMVLEYAEQYVIHVDIKAVEDDLIKTGMSTEQLHALAILDGKIFEYRWQFIHALRNQSTAWRLRADTPENERYNQEILAQTGNLIRLLRRG